MSRIMFSNNANPYIDAQGHGTATASLVAGTRFGVAKHATIHSVRVDDGDPGPRISDVIAGLDWVAGNAIRPAVVNLSIRGDDSDIADAIRNVVNNGITVAKAVGNDGWDACQVAGNLANESIRVAMTNINDARSSASNYGSCVDLFAPGEGVLVAWAGSDTDSRTKTGTSLAAPFVAGVAASMLEQNTTLTPRQIKELLLQSATSVSIGNAGAGSPNRLLNSRFSAVRVDGPESIVVYDSPVVASWHARISGIESWVSVWEVFHETQGWQAVSQASSFSRTFGPSSEDYDFVFRLTATSSSGKVVQSQRYVQVRTMPSCGAFYCD